MATCPFCHTEKPLAAPVCNECNNDTPFFFQVGCELFSAGFTLFLFFGFFWVVGKLL